MAAGAVERVREMTVAVVAVTAAGWVLSLVVRLVHGVILVGRRR